jgi:hypothetical protein
MDVTVAICAYNAKKRIGMVLESLVGQVVSEDVRWEVLVIDNASTDGTASFASGMGVRLGLPLRVVREPAPGLSNARRKAAYEAQAEVISFLDDDNAVGRDWVAQCHGFMKDHPAAGIVGARVVPLFEDPHSVPANFQERFYGLLSMYDKGDEARRIRLGEESLPVGAGMTGRRGIFRFAFGELGSMVVGRKGNSLAGGEDFEAMYVAGTIGWEIWYSPALRAEHWVPVSKLTESYWEKWCVDTAQCHAWLEVLSGRTPNPSRLKCAVRGVRFEGLALMEGIRRYLPASFQPRQKSAQFWQSYYRSEGRGWWRLLRDYPRVQKFIRTVRDHEQVNLVRAMQERGAV